MPIYRKGDDQFELEHRAVLESNEPKNPRTAIHVLRPDVTLQRPKNFPHHVPTIPAPKDEHYKDDWGNQITLTQGPGYMGGEDFPVSGLDVAKANAAKKKKK